MASQTPRPVGAPEVFGYQITDQEVPWKCWGMKEQTEGWLVVRSGL